ncbi:hypothetical protein Mycsm_07079 (plasmid) [Mycobacterium sp. JS623]|uniref:hypothetical protein n=1 Tax=Mycobacterium sp. JS623 TaxID=212767 RepID=UPI0002A55044|nr:hypothetical protein [Mycobacterium sp. JS623]AGB27176.1 hypothetical protein Mycsm_07079 [Mycobacterium sp. JS623]
MTSILERAPAAHPFVSQAVRVGEQCVDLTAQRTTCPDLVITPRIDASELGSLRLVDGLALVHRCTGTMIAAGRAEVLHDLAERLSTVDWDSVGGDVVDHARRLFSDLTPAQGVPSELVGVVFCDMALIEYRSPAQAELPGSVPAGAMRSDRTQLHPHAHTSTRTGPGAPAATPGHLPNGDDDYAHASSWRRQ